MDADEGLARKPNLNAPGGAVEPLSRAKVAIQEFQTPLDLKGGPGAKGERFEMWDPFNEVTYRTNSLPEIVATATRLQSSKFIAIDPQGVRTPMLKVDGEWQRGAAQVTEVGNEQELTQIQASAPVPAPAPAHEELVRPMNGVPQSKSADPPAPATHKAAAKFEALAERSALVARLEAALVDRYVIKPAPVSVGDVKIGRMEYRFRGDTSRVAFTASTFRLATDTNSPSVARSMVDVAEARDWKALRVSGNEEFKRMVWLEASARGVKTVGYEPSPADMDLLKEEREARQVNRIEPDRSPISSSPGTAGAPTPTEKASARGGGGRKAVLVAIEAVLVAKNVPEKQRQAIMAAATEQLAQRTRDGQSLKVKVYDKAAPSQRPVAVPTPEVQRTRDRPAPGR